MALTLGDNFSYQGAKPLDARLIYSTVASMKAVADSTMYDGCMAYCTATDKTYQWKSTNAVDETTGKWREFTSGGDTIQVDTLPTAGADELGNVYQYIGSTTLTLTHGYFYECVSDGESTPTYSWSQVEVSKGGHDIKNNGVAVTSRDTMNFTDFDIADDSTNLETDIKAHRLTQAEMTEIMSTLPGVPSVDAILFDERGTEYQIGWYVLANGTKKPVYQRAVQVSLPAADHSGGTATEVAQISVSNLDMLIGVKGVLRHAVDTNWFQMFPWIPNTPYAVDNPKNIRQVKWDYNKLDNYIRILSSSEVAYTLFATIQYTKTTDTPV